MDRREAVFEAVERLVLREGVHAVSMRAVAREARVSLRLVQYYGSTKVELLDGALSRLAERSVTGWQERIATSGTAREALSAFLHDALPVDDERREFHRFGVNLEQLALTDPDGAGRFYATHIGEVIEGLARALARFLDDGRAQREAEAAVAFSHGLGTLAMTGQVTADQAQALILDFLDRAEGS